MESLLLEASHYAGEKEDHMESHVEIFSPLRSWIAATFNCLQAREWASLKEPPVTYGCNYTMEPKQDLPN